MNLLNYIEKLQAELEKVLSFTRNKLEKAPEGSLVVNKVKGCSNYYNSLNNGITRKYIGSEYTEEIKALQDKSYCKKLQKISTEEKVYLEKMHTIAKKMPDWKTVFYDIPLERRNFIEPFDVESGKLTKKEIEEWNLFNKTKNDVESTFCTKNGERVRSKSELIIADRLQEAGIPYHYERAVPLVEERIGTMFSWHPDFKVLNVRTGKEYYWEHFGRMDEQDYFATTMLKLETYARNGIFVGDNLIISMESSKRPINTEYVDLLIKRFLK